MTTDDFGNIQAGEQAGLPGSALRPPGDAQSRISRDEDCIRALLPAGFRQPAMAIRQRAHDRCSGGGEGVNRRVVIAQPDTVQEQCQYAHDAGGGLLFPLMSYGTV